LDIAQNAAQEWLLLESSDHAAEMSYKQFIAGVRKMMNPKMVAANKEEDIWNLGVPTHSTEGAIK
jgi:Zn-dependent M28 family amino/carboxypeptidase